jgi:hypothetical protein
MRPIAPSHLSWGNVEISDTLTDGRLKSGGIQNNLLKLFEVGYVSLDFQAVNTDYPTPQPGGVVMKAATFDRSRVSKAITLVNYNKKQIAYGLHYAEEQNAQTDSEAYCLAVSRILELDSSSARWR